LNIHKLLHSCLANRKLTHLVTGECPFLELLNCNSILYAGTFSAFLCRTVCIGHAFSFFVNLILLWYVLVTHVTSISTEYIILSIALCCNVGKHKVIPPRIREKLIPTECVHYASQVIKVLFRKPILDEFQLSEAV